MKERILVLRKDPALFGIVTEPDTAPADDGRPAFIILNAGVVHRVGPNRIHVRLARALARAGFTVLRLDLSGLGDSDSRDDAMSFDQSSPLETQQAMDDLARGAGASRFVLIGICSGAGTAFRTAALDPRVAGAVFIDPYAFPTRQYWIRYYFRRFGQWSSWRNTLAGRNSIGRRLRRVRPSATRQVDDAAMTRLDRGTDIRTREDAAAVLNALIGRGIHLCLVFSGVPRNYNYQGQFRDAFPDVPWKGRVEVAYFKDADHTFSRLYMQDRLLAVLTTWAMRLFGPQASNGDDKSQPSAGDAGLRAS